MKRSNIGKISSNAKIYEGAVVEEGAIIHDFAVIYPNVVIKNGAEIFEHCVVGRQPKAPGCTSRKLSEEFRETVIGKETILSPGCIVYAGTQIGNNTLLGDNCSIREDCRIGNYCIISRNVSVNYNTIVGNRTKIMDNTHITGNAVIEDNVFISVLVATTNDNTMGREEYDEDHVGGPHIKRNTTIGAAANILPNTIIGENCIVGAGAVVTKDIPDNKVVMGVPAKIIRDVEGMEKEHAVKQEAKSVRFFVGQKGKFSKTISEADVYGFAGICGDFNPVHVNKCEAGVSVFGKQVAHGLLSSSLISTVLGMKMPGPGTVYLSQSLQFKAPVFIGDTVEAQAVIVELMDHGRAKLNTQVTNQDGTLVITGEAVVKLPGGGINGIRICKLTASQYLSNDSIGGREAA